MDNKTILTKEEFDSLTYLRHQLQTAMLHNYATGIINDDIDLCGTIVDKYLGKQRRDYNCTICKLRILSKAAALYFTTENHYKELEKDAVAVVASSTEAQKTNKPIKRGRPKKKK